MKKKIHGSVSYFIIAAIAVLGTYWLTGSRRSNDQMQKRSNGKYDVMQGTLLTYLLADGTTPTRLGSKRIHDTTIYDSNGIKQLIRDTQYFVPQFDPEYKDSAGKQMPQIDPKTGQMKGKINYYFIDRQFILVDYNRILTDNPPFRFSAK